MLLHRLLFKDPKGEQIGPLNLNDNLNIIFGKSASGKTRTFNVLFGISLVHRAAPLPIFQPLSCEVTLQEGNKEYYYKVELENNVGATFVKQDSLYLKGGAILFDREQKKLLNELSGEEERYSPVGNELSINYVKDTEKHKTALRLKEYFTQFKRLDYSIANVLGVTTAGDLNRLIVEPNGAFLDATILNLMNGYPTAFKKIKSNFIEIFPHVEDITAGTLSINQKKTIFIKEDFLEASYPWYEASSGMVKTLALLCILFSPLEKSLILIDEIENSLDYEGLAKMADIIKEVSLDKQIVIATHSPIFANLFNFNNWIICLRDGKRTRFCNVKEDSKLKELILNNIDNFSIYTQDLLNLVEQQ